MGFALFGFIVIPYLVQIVILWLLSHFEKWGRLERYYRTPSLRTGMFAYLVISLLLAACYVFLLYGEGLIFIGVFSLGLPFLFVGFPLVGLVFFCLGRIPQRSFLHILIGGQTILWILSLLLDQTPHAAALSGARIPINLLLKNIAGVLLVFHYGLQTLLFALERHYKNDSVGKRES